MINYNEIVNHFHNDINSTVYVGYTKLYSALLLYKFLLGVKYNGISLHEYGSRDAVSASIENAIVIGGQPFEDKYYDEYVSAFINANINEVFKIAIYLDNDKQVAQITVDADAGDVRSTRIFNNSVQQIILAIIEKIIPWHIQSTDEIRRSVPPLYAKGDDDAITEMLEIEIEKSGVMNAITDEKLSALNESLFEARILNIESEITYKQARIKDLLREINRATNELAENEALRVAVQSQKSAAEKPLDEVVEFVKSCNDIEFYNINANNSSINFLIKTVICQTNMEDYANLVTENNGIASFFNEFPNPINEVKACMDAIFVDQIAKPHAVINIGMNFDNKRFYRTRLDQNEYPKNHMSNPHINHYECFGSAVAPIQEYMAKMRYADALNQIMCAAQQLTLSDSTVMNEFAEEIKKYECIELPDGTFVNWSGLVDYLHSVGKINDEEEEIIEIVEDEEDLPLF